MDGDCGSLVVNLNTANLVGHVVLGCPESRTAYIAPARQVFQDIKCTLGMQVELNIFQDPFFLMSSWAVLDMPGMEWDVFDQVQMVTVEDARSDSTQATHGMILDSLLG